MALAMLLIPVRDGLAKYLSADYSPLFIAWCSYLGSVILLIPISYTRLNTTLLKPAVLLPQLLRTLYLVCALCLFFLSVSLIPLADAFGAYFIAPIVGTVLAAIVLKEKLTAVNIIAVIAGFIGALIIIRPGANMNIGSLFALGSGISFGCYIVATRHAVASMHPLPMLVIQNTFGAFLLLPFAFGNNIDFDEFPLLVFSALGIIALISHLLSVTAFRYAPASVLSPIVYFEIISGVMIGYFVFNDLPTPMTWLGIFIIIVSGLVLLKSSSPQH